MILLSILTWTGWGVIATILLSVVAIGVAIWSSRETSSLARKQIESVKELSQLQTEMTLLLAEQELFRAEIDYKTVLRRMNAEVQQQGNNILGIEGVSRCKKECEDSYAPILQDHRSRIDKLQKKIEELKAKQNNE